MQTKFHKRNKYNAVKQTYNGYSYHSKMEAQYAFELDMRLKAKEFKSWERQVKVSFDLNGKHICNYYMDFVINHNDGTKEWVEVKGFMTNIGMLKIKMFQAFFPERKFTLVK